MTPNRIDRFRESMILNQERWHDGIGELCQRIGVPGDASPGIDESD